MKKISDNTTVLNLLKIILTHRQSVEIILDIIIIAAVYYINRFLLIQRSLPFNVPYRYVFSLFIILVFYTASFKIFRFHNNLWRYVNIRECLRYSVICFATGLVYCIFEAFLNLFLKPYVLLGYTVAIIISISFALMTFRLLYAELYRFGRAQVKINNPPVPPKKLMIVGAGLAATTLLNEITLNPQNHYEPVCAVDDDQEKINKYIHGVKIMGKTSDIPRLVKEKEIDEIFICVPSATAEQKKMIIGYCAETVKPVKILPEIYNTLTQPVSLEKKMKPVEIEDILYRDEISFDKTEIAAFLTHKVVLVTGGGGSIGSELCRQIAALNPKKIIILDFNENNAYQIQQELWRKYNTRLDLSLEIASIRDLRKLDRIISFYRPDIIFHAAAHKHVPLMEHNPDEAIKNNIFGTHNVMMTSVKYNVKKFVLISSDKAVNPTNIMGATKRFAEMMIQSMNGSNATEFVAVRFGNVLGSAGSVVPLFKKQIEAGGPVTVTHQDIKRYFMTITEAVHLLMQAAYMAKSGQIFVLDMGEPVRIYDLAAKMIELMGYTQKEIPIKITGLRPGEKLFEELLMDEEGVDSTSHKKLFIGNQKRISRTEMELRLKLLKGALSTEDNRQVISAMRKVVPTYTPDMTQSEESIKMDAIYEEAPFLEQALATAY